jgi:hypothetical protein
MRKMLMLWTNPDDDGRNDNELNFYVKKLGELTGSVLYRNDGTGRELRQSLPYSRCWILIMNLNA